MNVALDGVDDKEEVEIKNLLMGVEAENTIDSVIKDKTESVTGTLEGLAPAATITPEVDYKEGQDEQGEVATLQNDA